jgi:hypothetical protein
VLQWLHANGCPWDAWTCAGAAEGGHLAVLQWLRAHGCPWDGMVRQQAAENGHEPVLHWARAHGCPKGSPGVYEDGSEEDGSDEDGLLRFGRPAAAWRDAALSLAASAGAMATPWSLSAGGYESQGSAHCE